MKIDKAHEQLQKILSRLQELNTQLSAETIELQAIDMLCMDMMQELNLITVENDIEVEKDKINIHESLFSMFFLGHLIGVAVGENKASAQTKNEQTN